MQVLPSEMKDDVTVALVSAQQHHNNILDEIEVSLDENAARGPSN